MASSSDRKDLPPATGVHVQLEMAQRLINKLLDDLTPYPVPRWGGTAVLLIMFMIRIITAQGWYIVTYALGIYLLNMFLAFLTPKIDPAMEQLDDEDSEGPSLPMKSNDEFKPFIRRLPEFKFWLSATRAIAISFFCSFFSMFDIPVFWPILLVYFFILFGITMRRQIQHMIKYRYVPWNAGKKTYKGAARK